MKKDIIFSLSSPYRDDFRVAGYRFGKGEKSCCIIGALRGNEIQQLYMCSQLVRALDLLEKKGCITYDREILIILRDKYQQTFLVSGQHRYQPHVSR